METLHLLLSTVVIATACDAHQPVQASLPVTVATPRVFVITASAEVRFDVEVAAKPMERERGLMFREALGADAGMLFVFDENAVHTFWMKNTTIPLDMIFIDNDFRIVGIVENAEPMTETARRVAAPSRYVLEVDAGTGRRLGIAPGQRVRFDLGAEH